MLSWTTAPPVFLTQLPKFSVVTAISFHFQHPYNLSSISVHQCLQSISVRWWEWGKDIFPGPYRNDGWASAQSILSPSLLNSSLSLSVSTSLSLPLSVSFSRLFPCLALVSTDRQGRQSFFLMLLLGTPLSSCCLLPTPYTSGQPTLTFLKSYLLLCPPLYLSGDLL